MILSVALDDRSARIDHDGPETIWSQVRDDLRDEITSGRLSPGAKLNTELELSTSYGVSRISVRRAIKELAAEGLVVSVQGRGTYVRRERESDT